MSIYKVDTHKHVEQTTITNSSFTHGSEKETLHSNIYEVNKNNKTYRTYMDPLPQFEDIQQWHSMIEEEESDMKLIVSG